MLRDMYANMGDTLEHCVLTAHPTDKQVLGYHEYSSEREFNQLIDVMILSFSA